MTEATSTELLPMKAMTIVEDYAHECQGPFDHLIKRLIEEIPEKEWHDAVKPKLEEWRTLKFHIFTPAQYDRIIGEVDYTHEYFKQEKPARAADNDVSGVF